MLWTNSKYPAPYVRGSDDTWGQAFEAADAATGTVEHARFPTVFQCTNFSPSPLTLCLQGRPVSQPMHQSAQRTQAHRTDASPSPSPKAKAKAPPSHGPRTHDRNRRPLALVLVH